MSLGYSESALAKQPASGTFGSSDGPPIGAPTSSTAAPPLGWKARAEPVLTGA